MDKLASLRAFITVVESGGFSETARRLNVSKALISKQVAQLEEHLGVRLLHRTTRRVNPTSSGQAYYDRCKPLLDELNEVDDSFQQTDRELQGELRISVPATFAEMHLLPIITQYARENPQVDLTLELTDRMVNLVEERIDLAIRVGKLDESSLVAKKIGEIRMALYASPQFIDVYGLPQAPEDLSDYPCVIDSNHPDSTHWRLNSTKGELSVHVKGKITVNNARAARDLLEMGNGIGLLPSFVIQDCLESNKLVKLFENYTSAPVGIYAVYLHRKHLSSKVRRFIDLMTQSFQKT